MILFHKGDARGEEKGKKRVLSVRKGTHKGGGKHEFIPASNGTHEGEKRNFWVEKKGEGERELVLLRSFFRGSRLKKGKRKDCDV